MVSAAFLGAMYTCSEYVPASMKIDWAVVDEVERALTASWILEYWPLEGALLTTRAPLGGEVLTAASARQRLRHKARMYESIVEGAREDESALDVSDWTSSFMYLLLTYFEGQLGCNSRGTQDVAYSRPV